MHLKTEPVQGQLDLQPKVIANNLIRFDLLVYCNLQSAHKSRLIKVLHF